MIKSKYSTEVKLSENLYSIFNSLIMKPIFVDYDTYNRILNNSLDQNEINNLETIGYFVDTEETDSKILKAYKDLFNKALNNHINLMYIIPTNSCNLGCKYCFIGRINNNIENMSEETLYKSIELFNNNLIKNNESGTILFYGGEPLMNFDLVKKAVNYVCQKKYKIEFSMVTNATLINEKILSFIKKYNISLGISIDGPKKITDINRVYKNSKLGVYDDVMAKLNFIKESDVDFSLSITLSKEFLNIKEEFLKWLQETKVKKISYNLLHFTTKEPDWEEYYKKTTEFIYDSNLLLYDLGYREDRIHRKYNAFYNRNFKFSDCAAIGGNQITILPNGDIEICHGLWNRNKKHINNINNINSFDDIINTNEYKFWQNNLTLNKEECLRCPAIYICGGGCALQAEDLFDNRSGLDKAFCIHSKIILEKILTEVYNDSIN
jgi:uncharacterized protein